MDFELFRPELNAALSYTDRTEGGRPPFDPVLMFKILVVQATNNLSNERAEFLNPSPRNRINDSRPLIKKLKMTFAASPARSGCSGRS